MASSNLATFDEQPGGSPARHSRHASLVRLLMSYHNGFCPCSYRLSATSFVTHHEKLC